MQRKGTIFSEIIKYISRENFTRLVEDHDSDRYCKSFYSWDHLLTMIYCQLTSQTSLREAVTSFNSRGRDLSRLGISMVKRSTFADANERRGEEVFRDLFLELVCYSSGRYKRELKKMIELIDSTPIQLKGLGYEWTKDCHRIKGLKTHVVYSLDLRMPKYFTITDANVNDIQEAKKLEITKGTTYVFDKGYYDYRWWWKLCSAGCWFVTRPKKGIRYEILKEREVEGKNILLDRTIRITTEKGRRYYKGKLRMITIITDDGKIIEVITNKLTGTAVNIAGLYKKRWQIELFFKWLKQNLKIKKFLGRSANAVKIQIITAMITYLLIWITLKSLKLKISAKHFIALIKVNLFQKESLSRLTKPPSTKKRHALCGARGSI